MFFIFFRSRFSAEGIACVPACLWSDMAEEETPGACTCHTDIIYINIHRLDLIYTDIYIYIYIYIGIYIHICSMMHKGFRLRAAQGRASIAREREPTSTASATARLRAAGASSPTGGCSSSPTARLRAALKLAYGRLQLAYRQPDTARLRAAAVHLESAPTGGNTLQLAYGRLAYGRQHGCSPTGGN